MCYIKWNYFYVRLGFCEWMWLNVGLMDIENWFKGIKKYWILVLYYLVVMDFVLNMVF